MIFKQDADNIVEAAYAVSSRLFGETAPQEPVIIKPNIVEPSPPPVTTDVRVVEGIIMALLEAGIKNFSIAEGSGTGNTIENFERNGYSRLNADLIDLDSGKTVTVPVSGHNEWNEIIVPEVLFGKFIISVPVLKEHSLCGVTVSLKNMVGILPAKHYSGYWTYKKSRIHEKNTDGCIADIISVIRPHIAIVDATIGMMGHHLSGIPARPPINLVYGSSDPLEADRFGCELLGRDWKEIRYLQMISDRKYF
jgi:uncharacterized protein (DUF362 family)